MSEDARFNKAYQENEVESPEERVVRIETISLIAQADMAYHALERCFEAQDFFELRKRQLEDTMMAAGQEVIEALGPHALTTIDAVQNRRLIEPLK